MGFLAHDQWANYVFAVYGISAVALGAIVIWTVASWRKVKARLAALEKQ